MQAFGNTPLWDLAQPSHYSSISDDDFLALLSKQFPGSIPDLTPNPTGSNNDGDTSPSTFAFPTSSSDAPPTPVDGINPQALSRAPLVPTDATPPLTDDSSPSPPSVTDESRSRRTSMVGGADHADGQHLKRKASEEEVAGEPTHKSQHSESRKASSSSVANSRRKSTGAHEKDESRLLRRKEQNRAAQRAFRERKEKHVKDLEDKVAELEAQNRAAQSENENLRDLLQRLQTENQTLKQTAFTFSVPHGVAGPGPTTQSNMAQQQQQQQGNNASNTVNHLFSSTPLVHQPPQQQHPTTNDDIDWNSLTAFDPSVLAMLDEPSDPQSMNVDYPGPTTGGVDSAKSPYRTIVSNPMFMSFADPNPMYDQFWSAQAMHASGSSSSASSSSQQQQQQQQQQHNGQHQQQHSSSAWSPPAASGSTWSPPFTLSSDPNALDDIFGSGNYTSTASPVDFGSFMSSAASASPANSLSPVSHRHNSGQSIVGVSTATTTPASSSSSSSSSSSGVPTPAAANSPGSCATESGECPKTKAELAKAVAKDGGSPFTDTTPAGASPKPTISKAKEGGSDETHIFCAGSNFPKVPQSADNIEVLAAWRSITSNPKFKDLDINELCTEFTSKAKCDGTKVVLEPSGVNHIIEKLSAKAAQK